MTEYGKPLPAAPDPKTAASEPLLNVGAIVTIVVSVLSLLVTFGVPLSNDQRAAIMGLVAAVVPMVTAFIGRSKVYSPRSVVRLLAACRTGDGPL